MLWSLDENSEAPSLANSYFEHVEPVVFDDDGTYVHTDVVFTNQLTHTWHHGLGEIITGLLNAGLRLTGLVEHDSVPWNALPGHMVPDEGGEWRPASHPERLAASFTLQAVKD